MYAHLHHLYIYDGWPLYKQEYFECCYDFFERADSIAFHSWNFPFFVRNIFTLNRRNAEIIYYSRLSNSNNCFLRTSNLTAGICL